MKSRLTILAAAAVLVAVSLASCNKPIEDRLDKVELAAAGINEQIAAINASIRDMNAAIAELKSSSTASSAQLQTAIAALESRVAALEALKESLATKDWAEATFATLDAQAQTAADLVRVQAAVSAALAGMPEGKTVTDAISEAIAAASQSVKGWVNQQLAGYYTIGTIDGKLSDMKAALDAELTAAAADIDRVENNLRTLNTDLSAAIAAKASQAEVDAIQNEISGLQSTLSTLQDNYTALSSEVQEHQAEIAALSAALESAKAAITTAYTAAINAAKTELDGKITVNTEAIADANEKISDLETKVAALEVDVAALQSRLDAVEDRLDNLEAMVQSVVFVPKYEGGCAVVRTTSDLNSLTLEYEVFPQTCASAIATAWASDNSILALNSRTVLTRSGLASIPITDVTYNDESKLLEVSVKLDGVAGVALSSGATLAVSLTINTGATTVSSPFSDIVMPRIVDLSAGGTANCYIVKEAGEYKFNATVRGNGKKTDGTAADAIDLTNATAQVLWESFGTADTPAAGSLVNSAVLDGDNVLFSATSNTGNAVIAVKDADNKILWSWHIWLAGGQPLGQAYNNDAGTMMDRNLGATSAEKGNPGALGLLYQWGRKDPFLGSGATTGTTVAKSCPDGITEIKSVSECIPSGSTNSLDYSIAYPSTFIKGVSSNYDWYCTAEANKNDDLWKIPAASGSPKTMYDPCPPGYRVPDGGTDGVWSTAFGKTDYWTIANNWDGAYKGMDFGRTDKPLGSGMIWYPAAGWRDSCDGYFEYVGSNGYYWSCTVSHVSHDNACLLGFRSTGFVYPSYNGNRANGIPVRCLSE